jgi:hypothetical protein
VGTIIDMGETCPRRQLQASIRAWLPLRADVPKVPPFDVLSVADLRAASTQFVQRVESMWFPNLPGISPWDVAENYAEYLALRAVEEWANAMKPMAGASARFNHPRAWGARAGDRDGITIEAPHVAILHSREELYPGHVVSYETMDPPSTSSQTMTRRTRIRSDMCGEHAGLMNCRDATH